MLKTHNCGELRIENAGQRVTLAGWVHRHRSHGGVLFINLRDRSGLVQVTFDQRTAPEAHTAVEQARAEWVLQSRAQSRLARQAQRTQTCPPARSRLPHKQQRF